MTAAEESVRLGLLADLTEHRRIASSHNGDVTDAEIDLYRNHPLARLFTDEAGWAAVLEWVGVKSGGVSVAPEQPNYQGAEVEYGVRIVHNGNTTPHVSEESARDDVENVGWDEYGYRSPRVLVSRRPASEWVEVVE